MLLTYAAAIMTAAVLAGPAAGRKTLLWTARPRSARSPRHFAEYYMKQNTGVNVTVSESGSGNGAKSLINKTCQIATMSRFMKDSEFKAAVDAGVFPVAHAVALDGLPILVHPSNPVKNLTVEQATRLFTRAKSPTGSSSAVPTWQSSASAGIPTAAPMKLLNEPGYEQRKNRAMVPSM